MSEQPNRRYGHTDPWAIPLTALRALPVDDQRAYILKLLEDDHELSKRLRKKLETSDAALFDLKIALETVEQLQVDRKVYSFKSEGKTGSGSYELKVRGGDTQFIGSLAWLLIAVIAAILFIMSLLK